MPKRGKNSTRDVQEYSIRDGKSRSLDNLGSATDPGRGSLNVESAPGKQEETMQQKHTPDFPQHSNNSPKGQRYLENDHTEQDTRGSAFKGEQGDAEQPVSSNGVSSIADVLDQPSKVEHGQALKPPPRLEDARSPSQKSDISNSVLREWVNLMNDEDSQAHVEPKFESQNRSPLRSKTPPASWAKWPSHTRHERTGPAGERDDVVAKDFAVREVSTAGNTAWSTDKPAGSPTRYIAPESRSLSAQVGEVVKGCLNRAVQGPLSRDRGVSAGLDLNRRRSSGHLEYPELEILPVNGGYRELQALEQQIDAMKRGSVVAEDQLAQQSSDSMRMSLSTRLAEEVHMIQHQGSMDLYRADEDTTTIPPATLPITPRHIPPAPQEAAQGDDHIETPESQVSYEDCVPRHMLEDERSAEDGAITEHDWDTKTA
ncbi:hypothetical protein GGR52DRAFT_525341 [Hypoxylon sp. FL1284]|nr:hypothetical protein GGR52DRAFT_525341 [Hypoxylon sp. FL1284]